MTTPLLWSALVLTCVVGLLGVGLYGLLGSRDLIKQLIVLQILAKAAVLAVVLAGRASGHPALGQSLAVTMIVADTVVAIVGLALVVQVRLRTGASDVHSVSRLRG
jgi:NADH:ubiquinone oxidoreductase subunit K